MNSDLKNVLFTKFESFMSDSLKENDSKETLMVFYEKFLSEILEASTQEKIYSITEKYSKIIELENYKKNNFDYNNKFFESVKDNLLKIPLEESYKGFYYRLINLEDLEIFENSENINFVDNENLFKGRLNKYERFLADFQKSFLKSHLNSFKNNIFLEIKLDLDYIERIFYLFFFDFLIFRLDSLNLLESYLLDLISLEVFFVNLKIFEKSDFENLNFFLKNFFEILKNKNDENCQEKILEFLNDFFYNKKIAVELSKLINYIIILILKNTSLNFFKNLLNEKSKEKMDLKSLKENTIILLEHKTTIYLNFENFEILKKLFEIIFNFKIQLIVFDSKNFPKFKISDPKENNNTIIISENLLIKNIFIIKKNFSKKIENIFGNIDFEDFQDKIENSDSDIKGFDSCSDNTSEEMRKIENEIKKNEKFEFSKNEKIENKEKFGIDEKFRESVFRNNKFLKDKDCSRFYGKIEELWGNWVGYYDERLSEVLS